MKPILLALLFAAHVCGAATSKEPIGLQLVVGSTRHKCQMDGPLVGKVLDVNESDARHITTFGGQATTTDIADSDLGDQYPHIKADALTHHFPPIQRLYVERFFTERGPTPEENVIGVLLANLKRSLLPGATVEIEWDPCITICCSPKLDEQHLERYVRKNPFQAFLDVNVSLNAVRAATKGFKEISNLLPDNKALYDLCIVQAKKIQPLITSLVQMAKDNGYKEMTNKALCNRLFTECHIISQMLHNNLWIATNSLYSDFGQLEKKGGFRLIPAMPELLLKLQQGARVSIEGMGQVFTDQSFIQASTLNYVLCNFAVTRQWPVVKEYLASIGFSDAVLERKTSPHNNRKNVWIITTHLDPAAS